MDDRWTSDIEHLDLERDGAKLVRSALDAEKLEAVSQALAGQPSDVAGVRLYGLDALRPHLRASGCIGALAAAVMAGPARPVRAILFDKTAQANWALAWHQDRVIAVREKIDIEGFGPWTRKRGALHVTPPFEILARMITLRVHLNPVPAGNAPLLIARGSHRFGPVPEPEIDALVARCGTAACLAEAGDVWLYRTPILHASEAAAAPAGRRVLQVDYADEDLPGGLAWLGV